MITLIMAVGSNNEWGTDEPVAYVLPLSPEAMIDLKRKIETVKGFERIPDLRDVEFRDWRGIWTKDETIGELLEDNDAIVVDIEIGDIGCGGIDLRALRMWPTGEIHFIANGEYTGDEYYSATSVDWDWLMKEVAVLKGEPVC